MNEPQTSSSNILQSEPDDNSHLPGLSRDETVLEMVVASCAGALYGIEMIWVREIRPFTNATPLYGLPDFWVGITALRGQLFAVLDLQQFLGVAVISAENLSLVLFTIVNDLTVGLLVEEIVAVRDVDVQSITAVSIPELPYLLGTTPDYITLLDLPNLLADPRLTLTGQVIDAEA